MEIVIGVIAGVVGFLFCYCLLGGLYTINQNERAVVTNFGRAERIGNATSLDLPLPKLFARRKKNVTFILKFECRIQAVLISDAVATGLQGRRLDSDSERSV